LVCEAKAAKVKKTEAAMLLLPGGRKRGHLVEDPDHDSLPSLPRPVRSRPIKRNPRLEDPPPDTQQRLLPKDL
jgi:hypothetical protein